MKADDLYDAAAAGQATSTDRVGGPRHYKGGEASVRAPWKCPACGEENVTRELSQGCEFCHAGEGSAKHVGVDPIVRPRPKEPWGENLPSTKFRWVSAEEQAARDRAQQTMQQAFLAWMQRAGTDIGPLAAFQAGWQAAMTHPVTPKEQTDEHNSLARNDSLGSDLRDPADSGQPAEGVPPLPSDQPAPPRDSGVAAGAEGFVGTAQDRTLLAALVFLREQVYSQQPEEVATGEWLSAGELDSWIRTLKGPYA